MPSEPAEFLKIRSGVFRFIPHLGPNTDTRMDINLLHNVSSYLQREDVDLNVRRAINSAIASIAAADQFGESEEVERGFVALRALETALPIHHREKFHELVDRTVASPAAVSRRTPV
jgi:hypothetical protein